MLSGRCDSTSTIDDMPITSDSRLNSLRSWVVMAADWVRNSSPRIHSSLLSPDSATNACRCFTSKPITWRRRGSGASAKLRIAASVGKFSGCLAGVLMAIGIPGYGFGWATKRQGQGEAIGLQRADGSDAVNPSRSAP